ncbi:MAG TPA: hypothetical protein VJ997_12170, partial [Longimicrobiales bacterium]|nr:hypothetical protein [Longimicrobiales bacterium]
NSAAQKGPGLLARSLIEAVIGPGQAPVAATFTGDLARLTGTYRGPSRGRALTVEVSQVDGALSLKAAGASDAITPMYVDGLKWRQGNSFWFFETGADGRATTLHLDQGGGHYVLKRVEG